MASPTSSVSYGFRSANLGPLTTVFTGPTTCLSHTTFFGGDTLTVASSEPWITTTSQRACYPPSTKPYPDFFTSHFVYSPGICPSGWTPAVSLATDFATTGDPEALGPGVTGWLCCPSRFDAITTATSVPWYYTRDCIVTLKPHETMTNFKLSGFSTVTPTTVLTATTFVGARGIPIVWESTDTDVVRWWSTASPSQSSSSGVSSATPATSSPSNTTPSTTPSTSPTDALGAVSSDPAPPAELSVAAKAGIGVSAGLAVAAVAAAIFFFKRYRKTKAALASAAATAAAAGPAQAETGFVDSTQFGGELEGWFPEPKELPTPANANRAELYTPHTTEFPEDDLQFVSELGPEPTSHGQIPPGTAT